MSSKERLGKERVFNQVKTTLIECLLDGYSEEDIAGILFNSLFWKDDAVNFLNNYGMQDAIEKVSPFWIDKSGSALLNLILDPCRLGGMLFALLGRDIMQKAVDNLLQAGKQDFLPAKELAAEIEKVKLDDIL